MAGPADYNTMENDREALMKLFHLSDLHIGKRVNEFSMIEDQKYILSQILHAAKRERPDGVLLSGDIYDSTIPSAEAVQVFDAFLTELSTNRIPTFIISGNHDSAERLAFGSSLMGKSGIYFSKVYNGTIEKIPLQDAYGTVWFSASVFTACGGASCPAGACGRSNVYSGCSSDCTGTGSG